jgi:hypothetical protein
MIDLVREAPRESTWLKIEVASIVPPGRAYREREAHRADTRRWAGLKTKRAEEPRDETIRIGARQLASSSYHYLVRSGRIVEYQVGDKTWVRYGRDPMTSEEVGRIRLTSYWSNMTPERRRQVTAKRAEGQRRWWANLTEEQREAHSAKIRAGKARSRDG